MQRASVRVRVYVCCSALTQMDPKAVPLRVNHALRPPRDLRAGAVEHDSRDRRVEAALNEALLDSLVRPVVRTLNVIDAVRRGRIESRMFKHLGIEVEDRRGGG